VALGSPGKGNAPLFPKRENPPIFKEVNGNPGKVGMKIIKRVSLSIKPQ